MLHSHRFDATGQVDQVLDVLLLQREQRDLLLERLAPVEVGAVDNPPDLLQRKLQLAEQQDLLQPLQRRIVIQPVARLRAVRGAQQADPVVILQGAYTHPRQPTHLMDGPHRCRFLPRGASIINYDAA